MLTVGIDGYYPTAQCELQWKPADKARRDSWESEVSAVLRPIRNPVPMHVTRNRSGEDRIVRIPELGRDYGYDLKVGSPLPPLGVGKVADFHFRVTGHVASSDEHDLQFEVRFPDEEAGLIAFDTPLRESINEFYFAGSKLQSDYRAPMDGYSNVLRRSSSQKSAEAEGVTDYDFRRNHYFRTRIQRGADGGILSSHYGNIYGDFEFSAGNPPLGFIANLRLTITYFNPTPNDPNVEFDTKRNLNPELEPDWP